MNNILGNEPAFPCAENIGILGLTVRQEFAARAMQGILSNGCSYMAADPLTTAKHAVDIADALIAELNK